MKKASFYDLYHLKSSLQKRTINKDNFTYRFVISSVLKFAKGKKILDVGCGVGTIDFFLAKKGYRVTGIDISKKAIETAKKNSGLLDTNNSTKFYVANFPTTKLRDKYDFLICSEVLEHIENDSKAAQMIKVLLKKKGRALVTTPTDDSLLFRLGMTTKHDEKAGHIRRYSEEKLKSLFRKDFRILNLSRREGILREAMFMYPIFEIFIKLANRLNIVNEFVVVVDEVLIRLLGGTHLFLILEKK